MARRKRKRKKSGLAKKFIFLIGLALLVAGFLTRRMMPHPNENMPPVAPVGIGQVPQMPAKLASPPPARVADSSSGGAVQPAAPAQSSSSSSSASAPPAGRSKAGGASENLTNSDRHALDDLLRRKAN